MVYDIAIIGGGAAGLMAATSAGSSNRIAVLEKNERVGKKILATGNGRCNFTNITVTEKNYYGNDPKFVNPALLIFGADKTIDYFDKIGVLAKIEREGRVYPYSGQASSALDVLRAETAKLGVEVITGFNAERIRRKNGLFEILGCKKILSKKVIITTGGCAAPQFGSDGSGFKLLESLGHKMTSVHPALTQLKSDDGITRALQGIKFDGVASLYNNDEKISDERGEILFTSYGISGPPILQLSGKAKGGSKIYLDIMPEYSEDDLIKMLFKRKESLSHLSAEDFFIGMLNKKLGRAISKRAGIDKLSFPVSGLSTENIYALASQIKKLKLKITGTAGWNNAQVTAGGMRTDGFNPRTMESKLVEGLYAAGEVLDIYGDCGGYNLQWAWSSGYVAGKSAGGG